jgi:prepilin-type N-terminal cleavage/methylation domain-containing protein
VSNHIKSKRGRRGFTLVEVLIALAILGIGILGVTLLFPAAMRESRLAGGETIAAMYAESVVDMLRAQGYEGMAPSAGSGLRILGRIDNVYRLYEEPTVDIVYRLSAINDLYGAVVVNIPVSGGGAEQYLTYIARK